MKVRPLAFSCSFVPLEGTLEQFLVSLPVSHLLVLLPRPLLLWHISMHFWPVLKKAKKQPPIQSI